MLRITLSKQGQPPKTSTFDKREISVGRTPSNDLVIPEPGVSSNHARILHVDGELTLVDLDSTNGTFVNGVRIQGPQAVQPGDEVYICAHRLALELDWAAARPAGPPSFPPPLAGAPIGAAAPPLPVQAGSQPAGGRGPTMPPLFDAPPPPPAISKPPPSAPPPPSPVPARGHELGTAATSFSAAPPSLDFVPPAEPPAFDPPPAFEEPPAFDPPPAFEEPPSYAPPAAFEEPPGLDPPPSVPPRPIPEARPNRPTDQSSPPLPSIEGPESFSPPSLRGPSSAPTTIPPSPSPSPSAVSGGFDGPSWSPSPASPPAAAGPELDLLHALPPEQRLAQACAHVFEAAHRALSPDGALPSSDEASKRRAHDLAAELLTPFGQSLGIDVEMWADRLASELTGLGKLTPYLQRTGLREVFLLGPFRATIRTHDAPHPQPVDIDFSCRSALELVVRRLTGRPFGVDAPVLRARTPAGFDVYAVHGDLASSGPLVTLRFSAEAGTSWTMDRLVQHRALPPALANFLLACVEGGLNLALCASPGADALPWIAALAAAAPSHERLVFVHTAGRPTGLPKAALVLDGLGPLQNLVQTALGLYPDRLCVADLSGPEVPDILEAQARCLKGTIVSIRANSTRDGLARLATASARAALGYDLTGQQRRVAQRFDLLIALSLFPDGQTRVTHVSEPATDQNGQVHVTDIFTFDPHGRQPVRTGAVPSFVGELQRRGIAVDIGHASP